MKSKKLPLILIPGLGGDADAWKHQIDHLKEITEPIVIGLDRQKSRAEMAKFILDHSPPYFALAGHSLGGWVAQEVAAFASDRISKLFLINTWTLPDPRFNEMQRQTILRIRAGQLDEVLNEHLPRILHPSRLSDKTLTETIRKIQNRCAPETYCRQIQAMIDDYSTLDILSKIHCKTLVIHGREDALFSLKDQETMANGVVKGKLAIIEDCGHVAILERPQATTALMRFFLSYG